MREISSCGELVRTTHKTIWEIHRQYKKIKINLLRKELIKITEIVRRALKIQNNPQLTLKVTIWKVMHYNSAGNGNKPE